jgi:hypothetical protein
MAANMLASCKLAISSRKAGSIGQVSTAVHNNHENTLSLPAHCESAILIQVASRNGFRRACADFSTRSS